MQRVPDEQPLALHARDCGRVGTAPHRWRGVRSALLLLVPGVVACVAAPRSTTDVSPRVPADEARSDTVTDAAVRRWMTARHLPGVAVAVVRDGRIALERGYGVADVARGTPVTPATLFQLMSVTKSFTALAVMMLVEEGRVALDAPIGRDLPDLPAHWRGVTVRQLLGHTSGIPSITDFDRPPCDVGRAMEDYRAGDVLLEVACLPLAFAPGTRWSYSETGYHLLAQVVATHGGGDFEQVLRRRIFAPHGMRDTRLQQRPALAGVAHGYRWHDGRLEPVAPLDGIVDLVLVSTLRDLVRWDAALDADRLVSPATRDTMWTPVTVREGTAPYGLGFGLTPFAGRRRVGHTGGGPGGATAVAKFPDDRVTVIVLANGELPPGMVQRFANEIATGWLRPRPSAPDPR